MHTAVYSCFDVSAQCCCIPHDLELGQFKVIHFNVAKRLLCTVSNRKKAVQISGLQILLKCQRKIINVSDLDNQVDLAMCLIRSIDLLDGFRM